MVSLQNQDIVHAAAFMIRSTTDFVIISQASSVYIFATETMIAAGDPVNRSSLN